MCISVFSATATTVYAMGNAQKLFTVKEGYVKDKIITYTINMASGIEGIGGAVVLVEFDSAVLKPVDCEPATTSSGAQQFKGVFQHGLVKDTDNVYSIAYINSSPVKTATVTPFFTMRFDSLPSALGILLSTDDMLESTKRGKLIMDGAPEFGAQIGEYMLTVAAYAQ